MSEENEKKVVKKNVINTPCESNINIVIEEDFHQKITTHSVNLQ